MQAGSVESQRRRSWTRSWDLIGPLERTLRPLKSSQALALILRSTCSSPRPNRLPPSKSQDVSLELCVEGDSLGELWLDFRPPYSPDATINCISCVLFSFVIPPALPNTSKEIGKHAGKATASVSDQHMFGRGRQF